MRRYGTATVINNSIILQEIYLVKISVFLKFSDFPEGRKNFKNQAEQNNS